MKRMLTIVAMLIMVITPVFLLATQVSAQGTLDIGLNYAANTNLQNAGTTDPRVMAVQIIRYLMTFLGIIAVVVILIGGFRWMTAAGNEDKVSSAKKTIIAGAIGLVIILAAFAIVTFVVNITNDAIGGNLSN